MWRFLRDKHNREVLSWLAGGVASIAVALWAVFTYLYAPGPKPATPSMHAESGGVNVGSITSSQVIIVVKGAYGADPAAEALVAKAKDAVQQGDNRTLDHIYEIASAQLDAQALIEKAQPSLALDRVKRALSNLDDLPLADPGVAWAKLQRGYLYKTAALAADAMKNPALKNEYTDLADRAFSSVEQRGTSVGPAVRASALNGLGNVDWLKARYRNAIGRHREALQLQPNYVFAWHDLLGAYAALPALTADDCAAMRQALDRIHALQKATARPTFDQTYVDQLDGIVKARCAVGQTRARS